jgi:hypothetical protein
MFLRHSSTLINLITTIIFDVLILFGDMPPVFASSRLPGVTPEMERPEFWLKKIKDPTNPLLTPEKIQRMNEENLRRKDLRLCSIKDLKEDWTRQEILSLLKQDWEDFGRTAEIRYGKSGTPLGELFWNKLKNNLNEGSIKESGRTLYALVASRTDIRVFPTAELSMSTPTRYEFDRFQHSAISIGSPVAIYHFSQDKEWAYVQTPFIRGWVREHPAVAKDRKDVVEYEEAKDRLIITGNTITVFSDPSFQHPEFLAQMGDSFPLVRIPDGNKSADAFYVIQIPCWDENGELCFRKGYIPANDDVHRGFLAYTQENIARQAFKMLNQPYGWGDRLGGRDCSRFVMDLFRTFGILMPRNSKEQAMLGTGLGSAQGKPAGEKRRLLDRAVPLTTLIRLPTHIMLYLGKDKGKHYVIHSIWGIQESGKPGTTVEKIGKVVVSDLSLGEKGPNGSLLDRITDIRIIEQPAHR